MSKDFRQQLEEAGALAGIFEVIKRWAGLVLGMANPGNSPNDFLGAFYPVGLQHKCHE
jgi:hypothetical protein